MEEQNEDILMSEGGRGSEMKPQEEDTALEGGNVKEGDQTVENHVEFVSGNNEPLPNGNFMYDQEDDELLPPPCAPGTYQEEELCPPPSTPETFPEEELRPPPSTPEVYQEDELFPMPDTPEGNCEQGSFRDSPPPSPPAVFQPGENIPPSPPEIFQPEECPPPSPNDYIQADNAFDNSGNDDQNYKVQSPYLTADTYPEGESVKNNDLINLDDSKSSDNVNDFPKEENIQLTNLEDSKSSTEMNSSNLDQSVAASVVEGTATRETNEIALIAVTQHNTVDNAAKNNDENQSKSVEKGESVSKVQTTHENGQSKSDTNDSDTHDKNETDKKDEVIIIEQLPESEKEKNEEKNDITPRNESFGNRVLHCLSQVPCASLIAWIILLVGLGGLTGGLLIGIQKTRDLVEQDGLFWFLEYAVAGVVSGMFVIGTLLLCIGHISTDPTSRHIFNSTKRNLCAQGLNITMLILSYIFGIVWVLMTAIFGVPLYLLLNILFIQERGTEINLVNYGLNEKVYTGDELDTFLVEADRLLVIYITIFVSSLLITVSMIHYLIVISANITHLKDTRIATLNAYADHADIQNSKHSVVDTTM